MRVKIILVVIAAFFAQHVIAQVHIGVKAGANLYKISGKTFEEEFNFGYLLGAYAEIELQETTSILGEVNFSQNSTTVSNNIPAIYSTLISSSQKEAKFNYLSIPILLDIKVAGPLRLQLGPQYSILMDKNKSFLANSENAFKNGDFSAVGGLRVKVGKIDINARYLIGLSNINDIDNTEKWKSQSIQATVGYRIF